MSADIFISYAWTSGEHREWVRLLASQLHQLGYVVQIDAAVDYGSSLSGFMRDVVEARHILLVIDENYVDRADHMPESGVGIETKWISEAHPGKPTRWLTALWVRNPRRLLPSWLSESDPKSFDFNANVEMNDFPGSAQLNELWRWIEGLPADSSSAVSLAEVRKRSARLERIDVLRDPGQYASPRLTGSTTFRHGDHPHYSIGHDQYEFKVQFSARSRDSVSVYNDYIKALGLVEGNTYDPSTVERYLQPGRVVGPTVGQMVVLLNTAGALCVITVDEVQDEINGDNYIPAHVTFSWTVILG